MKSGGSICRHRLSALRYSKPRCGRTIEVTSKSTLRKSQNPARRKVTSLSVSLAQRLRQSSLMRCSQLLRRGAGNHNARLDQCSEYGCSVEQDRREENHRNAGFGQRTRPTRYAARCRNRSRKAARSDVGYCVNLLLPVRRERLEI